MSAGITPLRESPTADCLGFHQLPRSRIHVEHSRYKRMSEQSNVTGESTQHWAVYPLSVRMLMSGDIPAPEVAGRMHRAKLTCLISLASSLIRGTQAKAPPISPRYIRQLKGFLLIGPVTIGFHITLDVFGLSLSHQQQW